MKLYFSGIGGAGLGPLAHLALDAGYEVLGSDMNEGLFLDSLRRRGVQITIGQSSKEIEEAYSKHNFDWIVMTSALPAEHPHIQFAESKGIKISKRDELINQIIKNKNLKLVAVAGTHGKTTTTALLVWVFKQLSIPVSYSIGSNISFGSSASYQEGSDYFIYEADEFDKNFLTITPEYSLITSIDFDHPDTYQSQAEYNKAFADFISHSEDSVICWQDDIERINQYLPDNNYIKKPRPYIADASKNNPETITTLKTITLRGDHNRYNAFLALTALLMLVESDYDMIINGINSYPGTQRRFEILSPHLISDYAHHPVEIKATIQMAKEYQKSLNNNKKLIVLYQPHHNQRQYERSIQEGYKDCFDQSDMVIWLPTYLSREKAGQEVLTSEFLSSFVNENIPLHTAFLDDDLTKLLSTYLDEGNIVLALGAGSVDEFIRKLDNSRLV